MYQKDSAAMMLCHTRGESEDHTSEKARKGSTLALKPGPMSSEVQNRDINDPTKRTYVLKYFFKKSYILNEDDLVETKQQRHSACFVITVFFFQNSDYWILVNHLLHHQ